MSFSAARLLAAAGLAGVLALACAVPARADVKAGVDAWAAGDFAKAVREWRGPAANGDPDALFDLAQAYRLGRGVAEDVKQAETLYARAAAKGHLKAADNYGLLLFQDGRREEAMPYVTAAADRGDPRAQYLLGIAYFNGDLAQKDWVRAYALLTLANTAGLPQAASAIKQMDDYVPLAQRQQAQLLAANLRQETDARRASQMAAADLGEGTSADPPSVRAAAAVPTVLPAERMPRPLQQVMVAPSIVSAEAAVTQAMRATGTENPADAGADFARPARVATATPPAARAARATALPRLDPANPAPVAVSEGPWKLQLGAFSVAGNADRAWAQVSGKAGLAGKAKIEQRAGRLTKLFASGWPDRATAQAACNQLRAGGQTCIVTR